MDSRGREDWRDASFEEALEHIPSVGSDSHDLEARMDEREFRRTCEGSGN